MPTPNCSVLSSQIPHSHPLSSRTGCLGTVNRAGVTRCGSPGVVPGATPLGPDGRVARERSARSLGLGVLAWLWVAAVCLAPVELRAEERPDPLSAGTRREQRARWEADVQALTRRIEANSKDVNLYSARGDARFFLGEFAKSVEDFDQMIELDPSLGDSHWRRGIACFYAGQYEAAAKQFEVYHSFDNIDRENGIWRYLSQHRAKGREHAREGLLKYEKDDREPFPDIYRMFGGQLEGAEVLKRIHAAQLTDAEREKRLFYAELYVGLNAAVENQADAAERHLAAAVENRWGAKAGGGPGWMWQVGRLHHDLLRAARLKREAPAQDESTDAPKGAPRSKEPQQP